MGSKKDQMAAKMVRRNPLNKNQRPGIQPIDVLSVSTAPEASTTQEETVKKSPTTDETRTESLYLKVTKKEKRLIKMHAIERGMFSQDVVSEALSEYFKNHPLD